MFVCLSANLFGQVSQWTICPQDFANLRASCKAARDETTPTAHLESWFRRRFHESRSASTGEPIYGVKWAVSHPFRSRVFLPVLLEMQRASCVPLTRLGAAQREQALCKASGEGDEFAVNLLISYGTRTLSCWASGALNSAASNGHEHVVDMLLCTRNEADVGKHNAAQLLSAQCCAQLKGHLGTVLLIEKWLTKQ